MNLKVFYMIYHFYHFFNFFNMNSLFYVLIIKSPYCYICCYIYLKFIEIYENFKVVLIYLYLIDSLTLIIFIVFLYKIYLSLKLICFNLILLNLIYPIYFNYSN